MKTRNNYARQNRNGMCLITLRCSYEDALCPCLPAASAQAHAAPEGAPSETHGVHVRIHAKLGKNLHKHRENQENACDNCMAGG